MNIIKMIIKSVSDVFREDRQERADAVLKIEFTMHFGIEVRTNIEKEGTDKRVFG